MFATFFNSTDAPVVVDDDGRSIPAGEWGPAPVGHERVNNAVTSGVLVKVDRPPRAAFAEDGVDMDPRAEAAFAETDALNKPQPKTTTEDDE